MNEMLKVTIVSAVALDKEQLATIKTVIAKAHPDVEQQVTVAVDPQVLGGIQVTLGSKRFDFTLQHKVAQIKQALHTQLTD